MAAEPAGTALPPLGAADVHLIRWLEDPVPSPDAREVALVERRVDPVLDGVRTRILVVRVADGTVRTPSPDDARDSAPRWSADGRSLVFDARRPDGAGPWRWSPEGGPAAPIPGAPAGASGPVPIPGSDDLLLTLEVDRAGDPSEPLWEVPGPGWLRDGIPIVERRTSTTILRLGADGRPMALTGGDGVHDRMPLPAPDGRSVAFLSDRGIAGAAAGRAGIWIIPAEGGDPCCLVPPDGPVAVFAWAPDGHAIAWLGHDAGTRQGLALRLHVTEVATRVTRRLPLPEPIAPGAAIRSDDPRGLGDTRLAWDAAGRIWLRWAEGGSGRLGWADPESGRLTSVIGGERAPLGFGIDPSGRLLAHVTADDRDPGELAVCAPDGSGSRRLTHANAGVRDRARDAERIVATSADGVVVEGWLLRPPPGLPLPPAGAPLVVSVHGGPHYPVGRRFSLEHQRLAARGYAVLAGNARGSTGYGDAFSGAIVGGWGDEDLADTLALTEAAAGLPGIDGTRAAITGVSYGGWMALWASAKTTRFRAAIAENGISDLLSAYGSGEDDGSFWRSEAGGAPWEVPERYLARSPLVLADRIRTPLLLIHAEHDRSCPLSQSAELFTALRALGRPVRFLVARREGHLMNFTGGSRFRSARAAAIDDWLDRHLRAEPTQPTGKERTMTRNEPGAAR